MAEFKYARVDGRRGQRSTAWSTPTTLNDVRVARSPTQGSYRPSGQRAAELLQDGAHAEEGQARRELMNFSRQLAAFVRAGIPIIDAIDTLARRDDRQRPVPARARRRRRVAAHAARRSRTRSPRTRTCSRPSTSTILRSAELTGHVDSVLDQLATYIERDESARRKIKSALTYPLVDHGGRGRRGHRHRHVRAAEVPRLLRAPFDAKLPLPTRMLLAMTQLHRRLLVGSRSAGSWSWPVGLCAVPQDRARSRRRDRSCSALRSCGDLSASRSSSGSAASSARW